MIRGSIGEIDITLIDGQPSEQEWQLKLQRGFQRLLFHVWMPIGQQPGIITFTGLWSGDITQSNLQFVADALSSAEIELPAAEEESLAAWNWCNQLVIFVKKHEV